MQFRLRTLLMLMAAICVYLGLLNAPPIIAFPIYCAIAWVAPAYWIVGVIYARGAERAYYIGGLSAGAVPFIAMLFCSVVMVFDGPWRWNRWVEFEWGETHFFNLICSVLIFTPLVIAFLGGWVGHAVYRSLQPVQ